MPRYDGTGPRGGGPMTGRGEGYCVARLPQSGQAAYGYAGRKGTPVRWEAPVTRDLPWRSGTGFWLRRVLRSGLARGVGRRRGRRNRW
jgi:hypothetical protein